MLIKVDNPIEVQYDYHMHTYPRGSWYNVDEDGNLNIFSEGIIIATHHKWDSVRYCI